MLFILFHLGKDRYALDSLSVVEVAPMIALKQLPHAPGYVAGLFRYRGVIVPVIDLSALIRNIPCNRLLSTRIILVNHSGSDGTNHILGLMAERIVETLKISRNELSSPGIDLNEAPYLGKIICREQEMIQCIRVEHLLPESLRASLFKAETLEGR
jgi:chemotaxis-related protein WspB